MASPPKRYLNRDGSNANANLNIDGYSLIANAFSGAKFSGGAYYTTTSAPTVDGQLANKKYVDDQVVGAGGFVAADYITSTNAIARFADSGGVRFRFAPSALTDTRLDSIFNYSSAAKGLYAGSSQVSGRFYPSALGKSLMNFSANKSLYANSSNVRFRFPASTSIYNRAWIDALSGSIDTRIDALEGASEITWLSLATVSSAAINANNWFVESGVKLSTHENDTSIHFTKSSIDDDYQGSSQAIAKFADSSNIRFRFPASSTALAKYLASSSFKRNNWNSDTWHNSSISWDKDLSAWKPKKSGATGGASNLSELTIDANKDWNSKGIYNASYISAQTISGGTILTNNYIINANAISGLATPIWPSAAANKKYVDNSFALAPMTYSIANIRLSAQQVINLARFITPQNKSVNIYQAYACNSSQASIHGLYVQVLSGTSIRFQTSSSILRQGYPISSTAGGSTTIRFGYSAATALTGIHYGTAMVQVGVL